MHCQHETTRHFFAPSSYSRLLTLCVLQNATHHLLECLAPLGPSSGIEHHNRAFRRPLSCDDGKLGSWNKFRAGATVSGRSANGRPPKERSAGLHLDLDLWPSEYTSSRPDGASWVHKAARECQNQTPLAEAEDAEVLAHGFDLEAILG